jgi:hypothetical protein
VGHPGIRGGCGRGAGLIRLAHDNTDSTTTRRGAQPPSNHGPGWYSASDSLEAHAQRPLPTSPFTGRSKMRHMICLYALFFDISLLLKFLSPHLTSITLIWHVEPTPSHPHA